ncbi:hypothetical protein C6P45_001329 [Maudiozyma exigua]|uniref:Uncharacterized protein n=1 Tax=Maudiozyma exigua TaxID=34358 RepID=A0A9P6WG10_MAUEX|nr:hypothetical protein C6P45_001329 [Kazachstania exigua]
MSPQRELSCTLSNHSNNSNQNSDNFSIKAIYEGQIPELTLSRPMSRGSINSNLSMTTKDNNICNNLQENNISSTKRVVIPSYTSSMLSNMTTISHNKLRKFSSSGSSCTNSNLEIHIVGPTPHSKLNTEDIFNDNISVTSTPGYPDTPMAPPMSLREKMKLLNIERNIPTIIDESTNGDPNALDTNLILHSNDMTTSQSMDNVLKYSNKSFHNHPLHHKLTPYTSNHGSTTLDTTITSNLQPFHLSDNVISSELDSIASTLGDDISYMRNFNKNTSQVISPVESFEEV